MRMFLCACIHNLLARACHSGLREKRQKPAHVQQLLLRGEQFTHEPWDAVRQGGSPAPSTTRATAWSRGSARTATTPEVAQAARWSLSGSNSPWQRHLRGASGRGNRRRRSGRARYCALGMESSSRVGRTFKARWQRARPAIAAALERSGRCVS